MTDFIEFYKHYDEEGRLIRHPTEFFVTTYLLDSMIVPTAVILDVAGGTGRYAIHYALKGHSVTLRDAVREYIGLAKNTILRHGLTNVTATLGDARDLSGLADASYNVVLCMGPAYHLSMPETRVSIEECLRVLRRGGLLAVAYVNQYSGWESDNYTEHIIHRSGKEMSTIMNSFPVKVLCHVATDGPVYEELTAILEVGDSGRRHGYNWLRENSRILQESLGLETCIHGLLVAEKTQ